MDVATETGWASVITFLEIGLKERGQTLLYTKIRGEGKEKRRNFHCPGG